jgi:hypothetical protein
LGYESSLKTAESQRPLLKIRDLSGNWMEIEVEKAPRAEQGNYG